MKTELVVDARTKRPRLEHHSDWQWEKADNFYYPSNSCNGGPTWTPSTAFAVGSGGHDRLLQTKL
jgi:hypothetical protein